MTLTRRLCEKIVTTSADSMGGTTIAKARQLVLDGADFAITRTD